MVDELKGNYASVYNTWKNGSKTASSAGDIVCRSTKYQKIQKTKLKAGHKMQKKYIMYC